MKRKFVVELEVPKAANVVDCLEYIQDSVRSCCGGLRPPGAFGENDPGDPMWDLDRESVHVSRMRGT